MVYTRKNQGTCSMATKVELTPEGKIQNIQVLGGCDGNLKGICSLVEGMDAHQAIARMKGIHCGAKSTSCPDQLARGLEQILAGKAQ